MPGRRSVLGGLVTVAAFGAFASTPRADDLGSPTADTILTISGSIRETNVEDRAEFDRAMLGALGGDRLTTWTPWTESEHVFEGVLAARLMEAVGAEGSEVIARALNDYEAVVPISDFESYDVLLAMSMDGEPLTRRDKGPIWIIYPWSQHPELDDRPTRQRSVWQLEAMHVR